MIGLLAPLILLLQGRAVESYGLVLLRQADTAAVEWVTRDSGWLREQILVPGRARLTVAAVTDSEDCVTGVTVAVFPWGSAPGSTPVQRVSVRFDGDSVRVEATARGMAQAFARPREGARFILAREALGASALALECGRPTLGDSADIAAWAFPGLRRLAIRRRPQGDSVLVVAADSAWFAREEGLVSRIRIGRGGLEAHRVTTAALARIAFAAPDYSAPAGAPYVAEAVTIRVNDSVTLAGTLTVPSGMAMPVAAVVTISGTGAQDRDCFAPIADGWRPFRELADTLGRRGIAVLRFDDRGSGASTGDQGAATERTAAADVRAVLAWLRSRREIAADGLVLLGHSEGVRIAMLVAADEPELAGLVLLSGAADTRAAAVAQAVWAAERGPMPVSRDSLVARLNRMIDSVAQTSPREVFRWRPGPLAERISAPVVILHGSTDRQVPADQADSLAAVFRRAGNARVTVRLVPGRNHLLVPDPDGDFLSYDRLESARLGADVKGTVADWVAALRPGTRP